MKIKRLLQTLALTALCLLGIGSAKAQTVTQFDGQKIYWSFPMGPTVATPLGVCQTFSISCLGVATFNGAPAGVCVKGMLGIDLNTGNLYSCSPTGWQSAGGGGGGTNPGGTSGQVQYNNSGAFGGFTFAGDCALAIPNITCTKTNGSAFAASATTDTTNAGNITSGTLGSARLPNPSAITLGGIESFAAVSHNWINTISTSGVPSATQPACGDLSNGAASCSTDTTNASNISSGTLGAARLPNPTATTLGGIESLASVAHNWINQISTSGVPSATQPACGDLSNSAASCSTDATNGSNISSGTVAEARLPAATVFTDQNATFGAHNYDFSGVSLLKVQSSPGYAPTTAALIGYDSTNNQFVGGNGTNTSLFTWITAAQTDTHVPMFSGTRGKMTDSGCTSDGSGNLTCTSFILGGGATLFNLGAPGGTCSSGSTYNQGLCVADTSLGDSCIWIVLSGPCNGIIYGTAAGTSNQIAIYNASYGVSGSTALPNGTTATTQAASNNSTKVATTAYVDRVATGTAGGDLSGSYPNPTVAKVDGVSYPASPALYGTPQVSATNTVTYYTPADPAKGILIQHNFCGGSGVLEGTIDNGFFTDLGATSTITRPSDPDIHHPCGVLFSTGTTNNSQANTYLQWCGAQTIGMGCSSVGPGNTLPSLGSMLFDSYFVLKPTTAITTVELAAGFIDWAAFTGDSTYVRYDTGVPDTHWTAVTCASSVCSTLDLGIAPIQNDWTYIHIYSTTVGTIKFGICNTTTTCVPSDVGSLAAHITTKGATPTMITFNESGVNRAQEYQTFNFWWPSQ